MRYPRSFLLCAVSLLTYAMYAQGTVEAEFDTIYRYDFNTLKGKHTKRVVIDASHNTIYSLSYGKQSAREMLRILKADGFQLAFTEQQLDSTTVHASTVDLLIIHGMPNDKKVLEADGKKETLYTSPLSKEEVINIGTYVHEGGSLLLFLSHFPGGSGALPLLEAFSVKFRDGYAYQSEHHISEGGRCGHFLMHTGNEMLNKDHPVFKSTLDTATLPENIKFYCGAAVFRSPEDAILPFPKNTINYTPSRTSNEDLEESSNDYAGMIGFQYGKGRVVICTDQGIFRSLDLLIDDKRIPVTIHDPESDNAGLLVNCVRWLTGLQE
ncbi:hypothetical protein WIW50_10225 [Flavobacteriaceae bacterium 3-367]